MEISDVPRLCGSTFHKVLIKIKNDYTPVDQEWWNGDAFSKNLTEAQFFRALISVFDPRGKLRFHNNPRDYARQLSDYKKGTENYDSGLGFPFDDKFAITVDDAVQQEYKKYLDRMTKFCNDYIQCKGAATDDVVEELRELIAADDSVGTPIANDPFKDEADMFYADPSGRAITKEELLDQKVIYLPAFLLGIWHYILVHRVKNSVYRKAMSDTALDWIDEEHKLPSDIRVTMNIEDVPVATKNSEDADAVKVHKEEPARPTEQSGTEENNTNNADADTATDAETVEAEVVDDKATKSNSDGKTIDNRKTIITDKYFEVAGNYVNIENFNGTL